MDGKEKFIKYAFSPNKLGYCGPKENWALFEYLKNNQKNDIKIKKILKHFETAYPYLELIARSNHFKDPFDEKVVEAYWIGNELLGNVKPHNLGQNIQNRYKTRFNKNNFKWLMEKVQIGATPHHSFHVFDIFGQLDFKELKNSDKVLENIDQCRINSGKILKIENNQFLIKYRPLIWQNGISFGDYSKKLVQADLIDGAKIGDIVSFHWDWACEIIDKNQQKNLEQFTKKYLGLMNKTI